MRFHSFAFASTLILCSHAALADDVSPQSPKRAVPDYDGRPHDDRDGAGVWAARVVLAPLYFTSEFLLRRPIGALTVAAERADLPRKLYDFFAFGHDHKIGFVPVGFVEFAMNPSVGVYGFWDDAFTPHNDLRIHYEAWPTDWIGGSITDRYRIDDRSTIRMRVAGLTRPDNVFYGTGPSSLQSNQSRFTERSFDVGVTFDVRTWRTSGIETAVGVRKVDLSHGHFGDDPSLERAVASGAFAMPFGFDRGYLAPYERVRATLDTRRSTAATGSSVRFEAQGETGADVEHAPTSAWVRYGGTGTAVIDLNDRGRLLSFSAAALFADPLGNGEIPFTELVMLGGDKWMHGYFPGRLVDRSAAVANARYAWPIAPWLDGMLEASVGNVFGAHLDGFRPELFRLSASLGLSTTSELPLEIIIGFGTETFEHGGQLDSLRVAIGVPRSF